MRRSEGGPAASPLFPVARSLPASGENHAMPPLRQSAHSGTAHQFVVQSRSDVRAATTVFRSPAATEKSYDPTLLFEDAPEIRKGGSRMYLDGVSNVAQTSRTGKKKSGGGSELEGRLVFIQSTTAGSQNLLSHLDRRESELRKATRDEIRRIERFDTLSAHEQIAGFATEWNSGGI